MAMLRRLRRLRRAAAWLLLAQIGQVGARTLASTCADACPTETTMPIARAAHDQAAADPVSMASMANMANMASMASMSGVHDDVAVERPNPGPSPALPHGPRAPDDCVFGSACASPVLLASVSTTARLRGRHEPPVVIAAQMPTSFVLAPDIPPPRA